MRRVASGWCQQLCSPLVDIALFRLRTGMVLSTVLEETQERAELQREDVKLVVPNVYGEGDAALRLVTQQIEVLKEEVGKRCLPRIQKIVLQNFPRDFQITATRAHLLADPVQRLEGTSELADCGVLLFLPQKDTEPRAVARLLDLKLQGVEVERYGSVKYAQGFLQRVAIGQDALDVNNMKVELTVFYLVPQKFAFWGPPQVIRDGS